MNRSISLVALLSFFGSVVTLEAQNQSLTLNAAPPGGFISITAQAQNPFGASAPCYWVIARFPIGQSAPSSPACTPNIVGTTVLLSWNAVTGATAYDLLRTNSPILPPAGIATPLSVATALAGTTFTDTNCCTAGLSSYTVVTASAAMAVFLLDNQNQATPQVRLTISNATSSTSFLLGGAPAGVITGPGSSTVGFVPTWSNTMGTALGTGLAVSTTGAANSLVQTTAGGFIAPSSVPQVTTTLGTSRTVANPSEIVICTAACTVTPLTPVAGDQLCVQNDDNVAAVITLAAIPGVQYESTARTAYKAANSTLASGGAIADQICIVGKDATHYNVFNFVGTWM